MVDFPLIDRLWINQEYNMPTIFLQTHINNSDIVCVYNNVTFNSFSLNKLKLKLTLTLMTLSLNISHRVATLCRVGCYFSFKEILWSLFCSDNDVVIRSLMLTWLLLDIVFWQWAITQYVEIAQSHWLDHVVIVVIWECKMLVNDCSGRVVFNQR